MRANRLLGRDWSIAYPFLLPVLAVLLGLVAYPFFSAIWLNVTSTTIGSQGPPLPPGCIIDKDGNPRTNPEDFYAGGALLHLGGEVAAHKGFGLSMLSALISGLSMIDDPEPTLTGAPVLPDAQPRGRMAGVLLIVNDPARFGDPDHYAEMVADTADVAKSIAPKPGVHEILVPGEPEARARTVRMREGIALPDAAWKDLMQVAHRFGVSVPPEIPAPAGSNS